MGNTLNNQLFNQVWLSTEEGMQQVIDVATRNSSDMKAVAEAVNKRIDYYAENGVSAGMSQRSSITGDVGVIQITGSIVRYGDAFTDISGAVSTERISADLSTMLSNPNVQHIVLSIDSPGGMVNGTSALAELIYKNRSKITAHVKGTAASAAYWIASAASKVYVEDTSSLGNIGAIMALRKDRDDVVEFISSNAKNKAPDPSSEVGAEEYQKRVDAYGDVFASAVARHRGFDDVVSRFGYGSVFLGAEAVELGLADGVMSLGDVIANKQNIKGVTMKDNIATKSDQVETPVVSTDTALVEANAKADTAIAALADRDRVDAIKVVLGAHADVLSPEAKAAILADTTQTETTVAKTILDALSAQSAVAHVTPEAETKTIDTMALADAILLKAGMDTRDGVQIDASALHSDARAFSKMSLKQIVAMTTGLDLNMATDTEVTAAMTTGNFPIILSNVQNKIIAEVFEKAPVSYRQWTQNVPLKDFKAVTEVRKGSFGNDFKKLQEGGSLRYGTKTEEGLTWRLYRFAKKFALTYEMIINDDLGMFTNDLADLIENVERFKNKQVYDMLLARNEYSGYVMADAKAVFHADHGNLTASGTAVSIASLGVGFNAVASQTDFDGSALAIQPRHLIIPFTKQWDVSQVINSAASNEDDKNAATFNPAYGKFNVIPEFELNGQTAWFLAGEKRTIKTGYLASEGDMPIVEEVRNSRIHGIEYELAFSFGIVVTDHRAMYKNAGA